MKKIKLLILAIFLGVAKLQAQVVASSSFFDTIVSQWKTGITYDASFDTSLPASLDKSSGDLANYATTQTLQLQALRERHAINLGLSYTYNYYDFSKLDAFSDTHKLSGNIFYNFKIDEQWGVFAIALVNYSADKFENMSNYSTLMFSTGANYAFTKDIRLSFGVAGISRMDRSWIAIPVVFLDWKITEDLTLRTFNGASLMYDVFGDKSLFVNLICQYNSEYIRLSQTNTKNSLNDRYVELSLGVIYNFTEHFYLSASVGANFARELIYRENGSKVEDIDVDTAPTMYLHIGYNF